MPADYVGWPRPPGLLGLAFGFLALGWALPPAAGTAGGVCRGGLFSYLMNSFAPAVGAGAYRVASLLYCTTGRIRW